MKVAIDISENIRYQDKVSVLGVASENGEYAKNIALIPKDKRRVVNYNALSDKIINNLSLSISCLFGISISNEIFILKIHSMYL